MYSFSRITLYRHMLIERTYFLFNFNKFYLNDYLTISMYHLVAKIYLIFELMRYKKCDSQSNIYSEKINFKLIEQSIDMCNDIFNIKANIIIPLSVRMQNASHTRSPTTQFFAYSEVRRWEKQTLHVVGEWPRVFHPSPRSLFLPSCRKCVGLHTGIKANVRE